MIQSTRQETSSKKQGKRLLPRNAETGPTSKNCIKYRWITFADKFDKLYNNIPPVVEKMEEINDFIQNNCQHCNDKDRFVSKEDISEATKYLKARKSDGGKGLVSNHILMSNEDVKVQL